AANEPRSCCEVPTPRPSSSSMAGAGVGRPMGPRGKDAAAPLPTPPPPPPPRSTLARASGAAIRHSNESHEGRESTDSQTEITTSPHSPLVQTPRCALELW
ncbi:hypothetical protein Vafri_21843, partial [Volvox africanus]